MGVVNQKLAQHERQGYGSRISPIPINFYPEIKVGLFQGFSHAYIGGVNSVCNGFHFFRSCWLVRFVVKMEFHANKPFLAESGSFAGAFRKLEIMFYEEMIAISVLSVFWILFSHKCPATERIMFLSAVNIFTNLPMPHPLQECLSLLTKPPRSTA